MQEMTLMEKHEKAVEKAASLVGCVVLNNLDELVEAMGDTAAGVGGKYTFGLTVKIEMAQAQADVSAAIAFAVKHKDSVDGVVMFKDPKQPELELEKKKDAAPVEPPAPPTNMPPPPTTAPVVELPPGLPLPHAPRLLGPAEEEALDRVEGDSMRLLEGGHGHVVEANFTVVPERPWKWTNREGGKLELTGALDEDDNGPYSEADIRLALVSTLTDGQREMFETGLALLGKAPVKATYARDVALTLPADPAKYACELCRRGYGLSEGLTVRQLKLHSCRGPSGEGAGSRLSPAEVERMIGRQDLARQQAAEGQ